MNDNMRQSAIQDRFEEVFKRLRDQDIEQFYANYQLWVMRQRVPILEQEIATLRTHLAESQQQIQALRPSAIALAVLARLQSNGVRDVTLLDQMLERGEDWLDRMMQRLDYCEQVEGFIQGDYTQWCINSLDGAYDWIDSLRGSHKEENVDSSTSDAPNEAEAQATAELLLQRLSADDEEILQNSSLRPSQAETETAAAQSVENIEGPTPTSWEIAHVEASSVEAELSTSESVQVASPESESIGEQITPWYALPLTEDESFDFEHSASMHDWIKILQADSPVTPEATETAEPEADGAEALFHPVSNTHTEDTPYIEGAPIYQDALEAREAKAASVEISFSEHQTVTTEAGEINELASTLTQDTEEAQGQDELPDAPETNAELDTEELAPTSPELAEIASEQDAAENANELATHEQAEIMQEMPSLAEKSEVPDSAEKIENAAPEVVEASIASVSEEEASDEVATLSPVTEEVVSEPGEPGEVPTSEIVMENTQIAVPEEPVEEQIAAGAWTQLADETISAEPEQAPNEDEPVEEELSQAESEEGNEELPSDLEHGVTEQAENVGSTHIALELEEGQLPWYEYLALEKADNALSENESAEGSGSIGDHTIATIPTISQDELAEDDMTQPFVRKEIQAMQDRPDPADIPLANVSNSEDATVNANSPAEEVASASSEHEGREIQREEAGVSVENGELVEEAKIHVEPVETGEASDGEKASTRQNITSESVYWQAQNHKEEAIATLSTTNQKKRQKVSFWQWLFRRKRKK